MKKGIRIFALIVVGTPLLWCVCNFLSNISIQRDSLSSRIGAAVIALGVFGLLIWLSLSGGELSDFRKRERNNFVFRFPRGVSPSLTTMDSVLAELVYDYGLSDDEVERIVRSGVHDVVQEYRKNHPLNHRPPSYDLSDTVFPYNP